MKKTISIKQLKQLLFLIVIILIIFLTKVLLVKINPLIIDLLFLFILIFFGKEELLYMLAFSLPIMACFDNVAHILLIYLILVFIKSKFKISLKYVLASLFFIILELIAHYYYNVSDVNRMLGYLTCFLIFLYIIIELPHCNISYKKFLKMYIYGTLTLFIFYLLTIFSYYKTAAFGLLLNNDFRLGSAGHGDFENLSININANTIAFYALIGVFLPVVLKIIAKDSKNRLLYYFIPIFMAILGFLTKSRSFIIVFIFGLFIIVLLNSKTKQQVFNSIIIMSLILIIAAVLLNSNNVIINSIIDRFHSSEMSTASGRSVLFEMYNDAFFHKTSYKLIGSGVTDYKLIYNLPNSVHNGVQQVLISYGLFGFIIFASVLISPIIKYRKDKLISFVPLFLAFIFIQTIQLLNPYMLMFPFAICYVMLYINNCDKSKIG